MKFIPDVTMYPVVGEKRSIDDINLEDEEAIGSLCSLSGRAVSPKSVMEHEKRIRREIANSNERRRMQSINAGFASLKSLLPRHEGEKLSKAAILQQTAEYIYQLEQEKTRLLSQNCQLKRLLNQHHQSDIEGSPSGSDSPNEDRCQVSTSPGLITTFPVPEDDRKRESTPGSFERERKIQKIKHESVVSQEETKTICTFPQQPKLEYSVRELAQQQEIKVEESDILEAGLKSAAAVDAPALIATAESPLGTVEILDAAELRIPSSSARSAAPRLAAEALSASRPSRIPISVFTSAQNCSDLIAASATPGRTTAPATTLISPTTTILTVLPSQNKSKTLTPVLDLRNFSTDADDAPATVEYVPETLRNHTVYIVDSNNSSCQKNLDTICEAIRHLEGDHLFSSSEALKEEVVGDEGETATAFVSTDSVEAHHPNAAYGDFAASRTTQSQLNRLTLHMLPPEPQEAPLELTTGHRSSSTSSSSGGAENPPSAAAAKEVSSGNGGAFGRPDPYSRHHHQRPGVIVVKNP